MTPTNPPPATPTAAKPWPHPFPPPLILPPEQPERFRLGPVSVGVLALCAVIHLAAGLPRWQHTPLLASQDIGLFVFGFLVSIALAALCWKLDARRRAGGIVFCFLMLLFAAGRTFENVNANLDARIHAQPLARERQRTAAPLPPLATDTPAPDNAPLDRDARTVPPTIDPVRDAAANPPVVDRQLPEAMASVLDVLRAKTQAYERAGAQLKAAGGPNAEALTSAEAIVQRRQLVKACIDANATLTVACQMVEGDLLAASRRVAPEAEAQDATRQAMDTFDPAAALRIRDTERRCLEAIDGEMSLFQGEFGHWHLDAEKKLVFDNPAVNPWYKRWAQQLQDASQEGTRIRQELAARHQTRAAGR